jgi:hypothetical protein
MRKKLLPITPIKPIIHKSLLKDKDKLVISTSLLSSQETNDLLRQQLTMNLE